MDEKGLAKFLPACALSLTLLLAVFAVPATAQTGDNRSGDGAARTDTRGDRRDDRRVAGDDEEERDWGWLGLLGLGGLLGLMPRKKREVHVRDGGDKQNPNAGNRR
jgi:MYXO-CTERM domain-containing protein